MNFEAMGKTITVDPSRLSDEQLTALAQEVAEAVMVRGLEIPAFAGDIATTDSIELELSPELEDIQDLELETRESLREQLPTAVSGYNAVMEALNSSKDKNHRLKVHEAETIESAFDAWLTDEKLALINEIQEYQPGVSFTLVATPNVVTKPKDIIAAAEKFGEDQPYAAYVWTDIYGSYSAEQLSGTTDEDCDTIVNFAFIPNQFAPGLEGTATVVEQRALLAKMQTEKPDLRVPSVLDAVTYWSTLRAGGEQLADGGDGTTFYQTYIRHLDLPEQRVDGWLCVPVSGIDGGGRPNLSGSGAAGRSHARVAVG